MGRVGESRDWGVRSRFRREGLRGPLGLSRFLLFGRGGQGLRDFFFRLRFRDCLLCGLQSFGSGCVPAARFEWVFEVCREVAGFMSLVASYWGVRAHFGVLDFYVYRRGGVSFLLCVRAVMCVRGYNV